MTTVCQRIEKMSYYFKVDIFSFHLDKTIAENLEDIKRVLHQELVPQPLGPVIDYITFIPAKNALDSEALYSFLVFSFEQLEVAKQVCRSNNLPVPHFGVVSFEPDAILYPGLPKMLPAWKQALEGMPAMMANYIIDQYDAEKLFP